MPELGVGIDYVGNETVFRRGLGGSGRGLYEVILDDAEIVV